MAIDIPPEAQGIAALALVKALLEYLVSAKKLTPQEAAQICENAGLAASVPAQHSGSGPALLAGVYLADLASDFAPNQLFGNLPHSN